MGTRVNSGRRLDPIWSEFERVDGNKAKCNECGHTLAALVDRMKKHFQKHGVIGVC